MVPGAMTFMALVSYTRAVGGAPLTGEMLATFAFGLCFLLAYAYLGLWRAAEDARQLAITEYEKDIATARRCSSRLQSFIGDEKNPFQDDVALLRKDLEEVFERASVTKPALGHQLDDLSVPAIREQICGYLVTLVERYEAIVKQLRELRYGVLAPLQFSPIVAALLVPVAGTGGLNVVQWLVTNAR